MESNEKFLLLVKVIFPCAIKEIIVLNFNNGLTGF